MTFTAEQLAASAPGDTWLAKAEYATVALLEELPDRVAEGEDSLALHVESILVAVRNHGRGEPCG